MQTLILDGYSLTISELVAFANHSHIAVALSDAAKIEMQKSRDIIEDWVNSGEIIYGITTGFGEFRHPKRTH
jgi:histidine ammonia-lyase